MTLAAATKVRVEQSTSSPGPTPTRRSARCSAAVPLAKATAGSPMRVENSCSKAARLGPTVEGQLVANACPLPPMWGTDSSMRLDAAPSLMAAHFPQRLTILGRDGKQIRSRFRELTAVIHPSLFLIEQEIICPGKCLKNPFGFIGNLDHDARACARQNIPHAA